MKKTKANVLGFTVVIIPENKSFSCLCPELEVATQGNTLPEALYNIQEAIELHLECLPPAELKEIKNRKSSSLVTTVQVPVPA